MTHAFSHYETAQILCPRGKEATVLDQHLDFFSGEELKRTEVVRNIYCERSDGGCISFNLGRRPEGLCWDCELIEPESYYYGGNNQPDSAEGERTP